MTDCEIYNNTGDTTQGCGSGGAGIHLFDHSSNNVMTGNEIYSNTLAAVFSKMWSCDNTFSHNEVYENGYVTGGNSFSAGIRLQCMNSNGWTVEHNNVSDNIGPGIHLRGQNNDVNYNNVTGQTNSSTSQGCGGYGRGAGISSCGSGNTIEWNKVCNNEYLDIVNDADLSGDNNMCDTASAYCDAGAGCPPACVFQCPHACVADDGSGDKYYCGDQVMKSCTLSGNMVCPATGLYIGDDGTAADPIVINGDGNTITGPGGAAAGIYNDQGYDYITIVDLTVEQFLDGIHIKGISGSNHAEHNSIVGCIVHDNGAATHGQHESNGIRLDTYVCNSEVTGCTIYNNTGDTTMGCPSGGAGIHLFKYSNYNVLTDNVIYNNALAGIYSKKQCKHNHVTYNDVYENGRVAGGTSVSGGIRLQCMNTNNWTVEHNNVSDNIGPGIHMRGSDNSVNHNNVTGQINSSTGTQCAGYGPGTGIVSCGSGNSIEWNRVCDNSYLDIDNLDGAVLSGDNNTCDTASEYHDASAGNPPACVFQCTQPEEPDLVINDIKAVRWCCCCIWDVRQVEAGDGDDGKGSILFLDDPEMAEEFGDEKLRKEVAEVLANDPKKAAEIAVKLADGDAKALAKFTREPDKLVKAEFTDASDKVLRKPELVDYELVARCCCCYKCDAIKELADLLDTELTAQAQHEMSDLLDEIVGGCCGGCCCCNCCYISHVDCCCRCGRFIAYNISNIGDEDAGFSLSRLNVSGHVRSADIVRPLDAGQSRWEVFCCYRMPWWPHILREVEVCADVTDWVVESNEDNNCQTEWL